MNNSNEKQDGRVPVRGGSFSISKRIASFAYAFKGVLTLVRGEHNAWIHLLATVAVVSAGLWFDVSRMEWVALVICVAMVWTAEALNTAIEYLADAISRDFNEKLGHAKDTAAAGVLLSAIAALLVAGLIFGPRVL